MRRLTTIAILAALLDGAAGAAVAGTIEPNLQAILSAAGAQDRVSALVYLSDRVDVDVLAKQLDRAEATLRLRHETIVTSLQERAAATQGNLLTQLDALATKGLVRDYRPFWIANCVRVDATPAAIKAIAARADVETVYYNYGIELIAPVGTRSDSQPPRDDRAPEIGLVAVRAPEVWDLGYTGEGILVATLDTGVDGNHPALASRWRGVADPRYEGHPEWAWFDPVTNTTFPQSFGAHGTHTMGTVCGGAPGDQIGVAPGAQWIHAGVIDRVSIEQTVADAILSFQWMLDPDGDPSTNWDVPQVCSNSWRVTTWHGYPPCDQTFWAYLDACEAAGTVILFSAGNEGPAPNTIGRPPDRATDDYRTCAVGAVDANNASWPVAGFSSRGPSYCTPNGDPAIKPDIAAPGVDVRSSVPGGGYEQWGWSGTSMASPHVNGVVALVRQACPDLTVEEVKQIIFEAAYDLGSPGEDNSYGWGMVDAYEAVQLALDSCGPGPPRVQDVFASTLVNTPVTIRLLAHDDGLPEPPTLTYIIDSLPSNGTLSDPAVGPIGSAPYALADGGNDVVYTPSLWFLGDDSFTFKADDGGEPPEGGESEVATVSVEVISPESMLIYAFPLDSDPGWATEGQWAFGQPTGGGSYYGDPSAGHTGNNVYGYNLTGNYSDDMPMRSLTTGAINCRNLMAVELRFWRWLGVESAEFDHAAVEVSNDGSNWTEVWANPTWSMSDWSWHAMARDISAVADRQPTVYLRWTMGPTNDSNIYPGWNIDDIEIWAVPMIPPCPGDLDGNNDIDLADLSILLANYGVTSGAEYTDGDIDLDGDVDLTDLAELLGRYGESCP